MCGEKCTVSFSGRSRTRITPACAGKRNRKRLSQVVDWDHPRVCGEKLSGFCRTLTRSGSPPRMRGKGFKRSVPPCAMGITPAYAGKRHLYHSHQRFARDHPRVCGEKKRLRLVFICGMGSPPRMRGKGLVVLWASVSAGITPAYAGKRTFSRRSGRHLGDHPRVCGEKCPVDSYCPLRLGSPPRMRGKVRFWPKLQKYGGITPAYAGKSTAWNESVAFIWDHPRVCGEKTKLAEPYTGQGGSPPRMRGKATFLQVLADSCGITPAYAGKSCDCTT